MTLIREFNLNLTAGQSVPVTIHVNQYDSGEQWLFTLYTDGGVKYTPSSGSIVGIKSDNLGIINTATVDNQGRVVVNETQQMTAAAGKATFELLIDGQTHGTANFFVLVEPKPGDNADLSESDYSLFQEAINGTSATAIAQGVATWMDENLTPTTPVVDASLTVSGAAADAKKTGDEISDLKSQISDIEEQIEGGTGESIPADVKQAIATLFNSALYKNLELTDEKALIMSWASEITGITISQSTASITGANTVQLIATTTPSGGVVTWSSSNTAVATVSSNGLVTGIGNGNATITASSGKFKATCSVAVSGFATLTSISAVYTPAGTVYTSDSLDSLKNDLVVTATYSDSTTRTIASGDYTLSGTLQSGTNAIVVSYGGKTTTFTVTAITLIDLITEIGSWTSARTNHTDDTLSIEALEDHWYQVSVVTKHRYCTLNISRGSDNLTEAHPMWNKSLVADISGMTLHLELKDVTPSGTGGYAFTYALANTAQTNNLTENMTGAKETFDFTKEFGTGEGDIGAIGSYVDYPMSLSYKIRLTAY